jgi:anti-sigma-K factor RskA
VPPAYIGVLTDAQDQPALLVGSRRQGHSVSLKLLQPVPAGRSARLWAVPANGAAPFVVGALPASGKAVLDLPVPAEQLFAQVSRLVVTQQPVGEPPSATLQAAQVLWQGHCAKLW